MVTTATGLLRSLTSTKISLPMNRSPLIAFAGGTVVIAVMVLAAFANLANAAGQPCQRSKTNAATEQVVPPAQESKGREEA